ncbi:hypothetical protein B0A54_06488 [Friedmanniomyces endolithicus]|uniref:Uncharacterized protein n=1 Tax=Friedmanniomyces endolithicus TaxID=329885 RepID=A0A4U0UZB2_9PEZI|nr:hypothetical protein LTS09_011545 [Friedmanniomyces endolithicus]TKA41600.1 hypothetical protein B0A54_06488 [Friedmanniomyces endolithicus]
MSSSQGVHRAPGQPPSSSDSLPGYHAPSGPPPSWHGEKKHPAQDNTFAPPVGPPPTRTPKGGDYSPPADPPPSHAASEPDPPPYDPWLAIPDNALLPPPPHIHSEKSPRANATFNSTARAHTRCHQILLWLPQTYPLQWEEGGGVAVGGGEE